MIFLISLFLFTLLSGLFSASETALFSLPSSKVNLYKQSSEKTKNLIAHLLKSPHELLVTILMLNVFVNILAQNAASNLFQDSSSWWLKVGVPLLLTLIFGEVLPKYLAIQKNTRISKMMAPIIFSARLLLTPFRLIITPIATHLSRFFFFFLDKDKEISKEELSLVLTTSTQEGVLSSQEARLIHGYLHLQDQLIKELATPKDEIPAFNIQEPIEGIHDLFQNYQSNHLIIYSRDFDHLLGGLSIQSLLVKKPKNVEELKKCMHPLLFMPENTTIKMLLRQFKKAKQTFAVVVDEYGSVTGSISYEDLMEDLTREIVDKTPENPLYTPSGKDAVIASGKLEIQDLETLFHVELPNKKNANTIGGWLIEQLHTIPQAGTTYTTQTLLFQVLAASPSRVKRIYVRKLRSKHRSL